MIADGAHSVFINCPFDPGYEPLRNAMVFAIADCGFVPCCSLDDDNGLVVRFSKISALIGHARFGIHDISRIELESGNGLPRFNMPLELGMFIGAAQYGNHNDAKSILILDKDPYRYQVFISDIAGHDIRAHGCDPRRLIAHIRNWLRSQSNDAEFPGGNAIYNRFLQFNAALPKLCRGMSLEVDELTFADFKYLVARWSNAHRNCFY